MIGAGGVLQIGDRVVFDDAEHQVVAIAGTAVRLVADDGSVQVVALLHLTASAGFMVVGSGPVAPQLPPLALLDAVPEEVADRARMLEAHLIELETGLPPGAEQGTLPRPEYDPMNVKLQDRIAAKAAEFAAMGESSSTRTIGRLLKRYREQGLFGLVDGHHLRISKGVVDRADSRLLQALDIVLDAQTDASTGNKARLMARTQQVLKEQFPGEAVPVPSRSTFYRLIGEYAPGRHVVGKATSRRQAANRPARPFTPTVAARPGQLVQIDSTLLDVMAVMADGVTARAELTIAVDVATRSICAALVRPRGTKGVDAALLLARMLVPEPMRPGWAPALAMAASPLPHGRLLGVDARLAQAAARPVIVPETIGIDHGKIFVSETFTAACRLLGISVQPARPATPTDKPLVERTFSSINTLFCQYVAGYTGSDVTRRGANVAADAVWTFGQLQDLLDEWIVAGWQNRPHDGLRNPYMPKTTLTPNECYAVSVARSGYLPLPLNGEDYIELLEVDWRTINDYGVTIDYRTYDCPELNPYRRENSGLAGKRGLWEVRFDPYDVSRIWIRNTRDGGWIMAPWVHLPLVQAPFADFTWRHARQVLTERGCDNTDEPAIARVLADILNRAGTAAADLVLARTQSGLAAAGRPALESAAFNTAPDSEQTDPDAEPEDHKADDEPVQPYGVFDPTSEEHDLW